MLLNKMIEAKNEIIQLKFYNSRTKQLDLFVHNPNTPINMYTCGPTVYDRVHLGNLKTFLWSDFVVQYLNTIGYKTNHIMNITDIDDKIISRLPEQTYESLIQYTSYYTEKFLDDISKLGIKNYTKKNIHKVTDNTDSMEQMVLDLIEKDFAYETSDGSVYFDSTKIIDNPFYVQNNTEGYESGRDIIRSNDIRNPRDFVLWKVKTDRTVVWGKKLTKGTFGWDTECCVLCDKLLGKVNIKMGGSDLKSKHHCNEISQAESLHPNRIYGDYWIHFGFLNFGGDKMSKSIGNVLRLDDIKYNYYLVRMYLLTKSYKNDVDYVDDEILLLKKDFINFHMLYNKLFNKFYRTHKNDKFNYSGDIIVYNNILEIISDNFNTFDALKELVKYVDKFMKVYLTEEYANKILDELNKVNNLFNILDENLLEINKETTDFINQREELRKLKQFEKTDLMREELKRPFIFEDENTGFSLIKKF
jgi:cysteinyl-tRNA synthetase